MRRMVLDRFASTFRLEAHVLALRPDLVWQQLFNRLQWDDEARMRLEGELRRRSAPGAPAWLRTRTRIRESSALIRTLVGHREDVGACAFRPGGEQVASGSQDGELRLWEVETAREIWVVRAHTFPITDCIFDPAGAHLVSASNDGTLKIWDAGTGEELARLAHGREPVLACAFTADGARLVSAGRDRVLRIWNAADGTELSAIEVETPWYVDVCTFSPDGDRGLWGSSDRELGIRDVRTGAWLIDLRGQEGRISAAAFSRDGRAVATAYTDGTIRTWNASTGEPLVGLHGHAGFVWSCSYCPGGRRLASAGADGTVRIWDVVSGVELTRLAGHSDWVLSCTFSPDGGRIASGSADGTVKIWDAGRAAEVGAGESHDNDVPSLVFHPDGKHLVSTSADRRVAIWDVETGRPLSMLRGHVEMVLSCGVVPGGQQVITGSADGTIKVWDAEAARERFSSQWEGGPSLSTCAFGPDGRRMVSSRGDPLLEIRDLETGQVLRVLRGHAGSVSACAFSPDGRRIVSASHDRTLRVWDAESGEEDQLLSGHAAWVLSCAFSPDGTQVVSGSVDRTLGIWEVASGNRQHTLVGHDGWVRACVFSPSGRFVISGGDDKTLRIWSAQTGETIATLPLPGSVSAVAHHPFRPIVACAEGRGSVHLFEEVGLALGSPVVGMVDRGSGPLLTCPACRTDFAPEDGGAEARCPAAACGQQMALASFVVREQPLSWAAPWWEDVWAAASESARPPGEAEEGAIPPVVKSLEVAGSVETAFQRFTVDIAQWWPLDVVSIGQQRTRTCVLEGRAGGRVYEVHADGSEFPWGKVDVWDPPKRLRLIWHPGVAPEASQLVTVCFAAADDGTRIELVHSRWENLGEPAREGRDVYQQGWDMILSRYAESFDPTSRHSQQH